MLVVFASALVFTTLALHLGRLPLMADEQRNAEVAREMRESGAWLVPTFNGVDFLDKPVFYYKAVAISLAALGNTETAARLPNVVFGLALLAMVHGFCRKVYGQPRVAWLATLVVATMPLYFALARIVIFDMALACFVCGAIFAGYLAEETEGRSRRNWYLLAAAATGLATLVKGPVGFLIPLLVGLVFHPLAGRRGAWRRIFAPLNLLVFFGLTMPWFVGLCLAKPDFLHYGLVEESFHRFTNAQTFQRGKPFYYFLLIMAGTFFPWSLLLPAAFVTAWQERRTGHRADLLALVWTVLVVGFFSISQSKQAVYILSVTVACGLLVARMADAALTDPDGRAARRLRTATGVLTGFCLILLGAVLWGLNQPDKFAALVRTSGEGVKRMHDYAGLLALFFGVVVFGGTAAVWRRSAGWCFLTLALFWPGLLALNMRGIEVILTHRSDKEMAGQLSSLPRETELAGLQCYPSGLSFYRGQTLTLITADGGELTSKYIRSVLARPGPWPAHLIPLAESDHWLATRRKPVYLIVREETAERQRWEQIATARGTTLQPLNRKYFGILLPAPDRR
jgi:4-amino-4-deoxy-L-arabinose transferase-like glycosyltransferase